MFVVILINIHGVIYVIVIPRAQVLFLIHTHKHKGVSPSASAYISGKARVPVVYVPCGLITYMCKKLLACFTSAFILGFVNFDSGHWKQRKNNDKELLC